MSQSTPMIPAEHGTFRGFQTDTPSLSAPRQFRGFQTRPGTTYRAAELAAQSRCDVPGCHAHQVAAA